MLKQWEPPTQRASRALSPAAAAAARRARGARRTPPPICATVCRFVAVATGTDRAEKFPGRTTEGGAGDRSVTKQAPCLRLGWEILVEPASCAANICFNRDFYSDFHSDFYRSGQGTGQGPTCHPASPPRSSRGTPARAAGRGAAGASDLSRAQPVPIPVKASRQSLQRRGGQRAAEHVPARTSRGGKTGGSVTARAFAGANANGDARHSRWSNLVRTMLLLPARICSFSSGAEADTAAGIAGAPFAGTLQCSPGNRGVPFAGTNRRGPGGRNRRGPVELQRGPVERPR